MVVLLLVPIHLLRVWWEILRDGWTCLSWVSSPGLHDVPFLSSDELVLRGGKCLLMGALVHVGTFLS